MKLYDFTMAPNARRVRIFLAEKGLEVDMISVDLSKKEQMNDEYKAVNPRLAVPASRMPEFDSAASPLSPKRKHK